MPRIILLCHQKGGVGKSTITLNLAKLLNENYKVSIIDMDKQGSIFSLRSKHDIDTYNEDNLDEVLNSDYDFVFIDTPPYATNYLPKLIQLADVIVVPTKPGLYDFFAIATTIDLIEEQNKLKNSLIVYNLVKPNTNLRPDMSVALKSYNIKIANTYLSDLVDFTRSAVNPQLTNKKAIHQVNELLKEIIALMRKTKK